MIKHKWTASQIIIKWTPTSRHNTSQSYRCDFSRSQSLPLSLMFIMLNVLAFFDSFNYAQLNSMLNFTFKPTYVNGVRVANSLVACNWCIDFHCYRVLCRIYLSILLFAGVRLFPTLGCDAQCCHDGHHREFMDRSLWWSCQVIGYVYLAWLVLPNCPPECFCQLMLPQAPHANPLCPSAPPPAVTWCFLTLKVLLTLWVCNGVSLSCVLSMTDSVYIVPGHLYFLFEK